MKHYSLERSPVEEGSRGSWNWNVFFFCLFFSYQCVLSLIMWSIYKKKYMVKVAIGSCCVPWLFFISLILESLPLSVATGKDDTVTSDLFHANQPQLPPSPPPPPQIITSLEPSHLQQFLSRFIEKIVFLLTYLKRKEKKMEKRI